MNKRSDFIPFALPSFSSAEEQAIIKVLRSGWVSTGKVCREFETSFASRLNIKHAFALNSATAGLHLGLKAFGIGEGDLVLTSPFTFTATAEIARYEQAHPLFADIDEETFNIDPDRVEEAVRKHPGIGAVIPVHIGGLLCDMEQITAIAGQKEIPVMEDAAHAFPVPSPKGWGGALGDIGVFSFYATKPITTGEGGMAVTGSDEYAEKIRLLRLHGINKIVWDRYRAKETSWEYDVTAAGYKYNLSDLLAAVGVEQLKKAELMRTGRKKIADRYNAAFGGEDYLQLPPRAENHAWHLYILRIVPEKLRIDRDEFLQKLTEANIGVSLHFRPLHLMSYYRNSYDLRPEDFPAAYRVYQTCFSIPIYPGLTEEQVEYICGQVIAIGRGHRK